MRHTQNCSPMRVKLFQVITLIALICLLMTPFQGVAKTALPKMHDFECYDILTDMNASEYKGLARIDYGVATKEMNFSPKFDVTGQAVVLYTSHSGAKIYEATPIVRFEGHSGQNLTALWKSLRRGNLEGGFPAFAYWEVRYSWPGKAIVKKIVAGSKVYSFNAAEVEVHVSHDIKLPQWKWTKQPSKKQVEKWKKYSCEAANHEKLHINPTRKYILDFMDEIPNLSANSVNDLRHQLNLLWQKTLKSIKDENTRIDTATNHGQKRLKN